MVSTNIYFLNSDLGIKHTGIESSALLRSRLFINQLGVVPTFITCKYRSQVGAEVQELKNKGKLEKEVSVVNLYDYFQQLVCSEDIYLSLYNGEFVIPFQGIKTQQYVHSGGDVRINVVYNPVNQRLHYIVHFHQGKKWRRDYYHEGGSLSCSHFLDQCGHKVHQEVFYYSNGTPCFIKSYFYKDDGTRSSMKVQILNTFGQIMRVIDSEEALIEYFLLQYLAGKEGTNVLLIDKNRFFYQPAINIKKYYGNDKIKVISAIHNLHVVNYHRKETSRINVNYVSVFADLSQPDAVIVQTNIQKNDIYERFGNQAPIYAIPHTYENLFKGRSFIARNRFKAVYFARYDRDKYHEFAIEAFAKVIVELPQAELHCYGAGARLLELQEMVQKLKLTQNVFLHDWCENVSVQYESAALSIISSASESFSLAIAESLAHGCPVVGFDVPYGPKELVCSDNNGYLVPFRDTDAMANRVLAIMKNPELLKELSNNAREGANRYSEPVVKALWQEVFQKMT